NSRVLKRNAWFLQSFDDDSSALPVGGGGAGGGAGFGGAGSFGRSNVSKCQWNIGMPSTRPYTMGSVPPGNGNVTGNHPNSGNGSGGVVGASVGGAPCGARGGAFTLGCTF